MLNTSTQLSYTKFYIPATLASTQWSLNFKDSFFISIFKREPRVDETAVLHVNGDEKYRGDLREYGLVTNIIPQYFVNSTTKRQQNTCLKYHLQFFYIVSIKLN